MTDPDLRPMVVRSVVEREALDQLPRGLTSAHHRGHGFGQRLALLAGAKVPRLSIGANSSAPA